jgi:hypothetical protein
MRPVRKNSASSLPSVSFFPLFTVNLNGSTQDSEVLLLAKPPTKMNTPAKKSITLVQEPVTLADGSTFVPMEVKTNSDALRASLLMLFKHVADVHVTLVEIVAEKFDLKVDDIMNAVTDDPRWQTMLVDPLITDLTVTATTNSVAKPKATKKKPAIVIADEPELVFD